MVVGVSRCTGMGEGGVEVHKGKGDYIELSRGRNFKTCLIIKNESVDLNKTGFKKDMLKHVLLVLWLIRHNTTKTQQILHFNFPYWQICCL